MLLRQRPRQSKLKKHFQYPSADKQVIVTFVLLVLLSFFASQEIDEVLKGRLKWYEKTAKRKVYYKGSFETGSSKVIDSDVCIACVVVFFRVARN